MEQQEVTIGQVTYELRRGFQGTRPPGERMEERIVQDIPTIQFVDGDGGHKIPARANQPYRQSVRIFYKFIGELDTEAAQPPAKAAV